MTSIRPSICVLMKDQMLDIFNYSRGSRCHAKPTLTSMPNPLFCLFHLVECQAQTHFDKNMQTSNKTLLAMSDKKGLTLSIYCQHTWASSKSPGEGVQFFSAGGADFSGRGGTGVSLQKFSLKFHRVIQINKNRTFATISSTWSWSWSPAEKNWTPSPGLLEHAHVWWQQWHNGQCMCMLCSSSHFVATGKK